MKTENYIIGCMLLYGQGLSLTVLDQLDDTYFLDKTNKKIFNIFQEANQKGIKINPSSLLLYCEEDNYKTSLIQKALSCMEEINSKGGMDYAIAKLIEKKQQREYIKVVQTFRNRINEPGAEEQLIKDLNETTKHFTSKKTTCLDPQSIIERLKNKRFAIGIGIENIDLENRNGTMTVVCARTSEGKTTFMLNSLMGLLLTNPDNSFLFYSFEEPTHAIYVKLFLIFLNHINPSHRIFSTKNPYKYLFHIMPYLDREEHMDVQIFYQDFEKFILAKKLIIFDQNFSPDELASSINQYASTLEVGCVYIDYIQKINKPNGNKDTRLEFLASASSTILRKSIDCNIPIVVGAQLNREAIKSEPSIGHIRECGDIEHDANTVIMLRKENEGEEVKELGLYVLKNREGSTYQTATLELEGKRLAIRRKVW